MKMEQAIKKADVLLEALPYIKSYTNKIFVIKFGGSALINPEIKTRVLEDIVFLSYVGIRPILVHGGGPFINDELKKQGIKVEFKDGLRVTPKESMQVVNSVLNGVNQGIVNDIRKLGGRAQALNTVERNVIKTKPYKQDSQLHFVGEIDRVEAHIIRKAFRLRSVPVISPVGIGLDNELYNVNADEVSSAVAVSLKATKLVLLTDVKGIMRNKDDENTLVSTLSMEETSRLIDENIIQGGMIPKVKACITALNGSVSKTHIIDGRIPHSLLLEIFTDKGIGTEIVK
ncbi:MAG: acetylglutamate kinase [Candidatus Omnitrophica bacterium]|nr:acetylglutamate kinase [Candidatus Omnitrophota bacterium]MBU1852932.1 acetylglutamate kinase [Candidatus Omnitrophota bacterium]